MRAYPKLKVDLEKFRENYRLMNQLCERGGVEMAFVIKGCAGFPKVVETAVKEGAKIIATSRFEQFQALGENWHKAEKLLLRIPMPSEIPDVIKWCDMSLESDLDVLKMLNREAKKQQTIHQVILMIDLGDLREGFWDPQELVNAAMEVENSMDNLELIGVGTNLFCYGAVKPTPEKMDQLVKVKDQVEAAIGRELKYVSGGGTTSVPLVYDGTMNKDVNMLRVGEAVILGRDLLEIFGCKVEGMHNDVFVLESQLAEVREKPSYPEGEFIVDAFGLKPEFEDKGIIKHGIVGAGKVDYGYSDMLIPRDKGLEVLGASSDHTIVNMTDMETEPKVGDVVSFNLAYANIVHLASRQDINIEYVNE